MNMKQFLVGPGCLVILAIVAGCTDRKPASSAPAAPVSAAPQPLLSAASQARGFSGKVTETMSTAGYTYVQVDTGTEKIWAAAPQFAVKVGDSVSIREGTPMMNYHSQTLNRDFEVVYFTGNVAIKGAPGTAGDGGAVLPQGHPPITGKDAGPSGGHPPLSGAVKPTVDLSGIKKAEGGSTVQEIFADKTKLNGKEVKVRGKVVKYNANIMGKNWLHIQDGTGAPGSNDLLLTTDSPVKVGDVVLATGTVLTDKDFGYGYKYAVMIDKAKVVVE